MLNRLSILSIVFAAACSSTSLPASDSSAERFIGPWRISLLSEVTVFSDYVFDKTGGLTLLRAVADGQGVDPTQSAGVVRSVSTSESCVFGTKWHNDDDTTLVIEGSCSDQQARDIQLVFADDKIHVAEEVTVHGVGGDPNWMQPVAWQFEKCDQHPCK